MENYDLDIEKAILGECINSTENVRTLMEIGVQKDDFYLKKHQEIFEGLLILLEKNNTVDIYLLSLELKGKVYSSYLSELMESAMQTSITNMKSYIKIMLDFSEKRKYIQLFKDIEKNQYNNIEEFINKGIADIQKSKRLVDNLGSITTINKVKSYSLDETEKIETGFKILDNRILGFVTGSLSILTGYAGNGKSTMVNQMFIAESISQGYKVFAYSPELTNSNFKNWLYSTIADEEDFYYDNDARNYKLKSGTDELIDKWIYDKLYIYNDNSIVSSETKLLSDMEQLAKKKDVRVFIIDNLMKIQLENSFTNEYLAQKNFVNKLKEFAKKYKAVVHLVAHPRKSNGASKKISIFDIAGSSDITNLADYVMSISRVNNEDRKSERSLKDAVLKILKDRPSGFGEFSINLDYDRERKRFYTNTEELNKSYGYKNIEEEHMPKIA